MRGSPRKHRVARPKHQAACRLDLAGFVQPSPCFAATEECAVVRIVWSAFDNHSAILEEDAAQPGQMRADPVRPRRPKPRACAEALDVRLLLQRLGHAVIGTV